MTQPYYQDDLVTLYQGNCMEVTEWLAAMVLVTDPPYGMAYRGWGGGPGHGSGRGHRPIQGDHSPELRDAALALWGERPALVFGTWRVPKPPATRQVIVWDKSDNGPGMGALDLPWGPSHEEVYVLGRGFTGRRGSSVLRFQPYNSQARSRPNHPTPKPVPLMEALIAKCPDDLVTDPFAGSGATLMAARNLGRRAIGVELEERYCEVIARRLEQDVLDVEGVA